MVPSSLTPSDSDMAHTFTVSLTVYSLIKKKTAKGKAATPKEAKAVKVKELQFSVDDMNYLDFLQSILDKHGRDQYMLLARKQFAFKYIPPKVKGQHASDAMDVDNEANYKEMVKKIQQDNPSSTRILVDMKGIEKLPALDANIDNDDDNEITDDDDNKVFMMKDICTYVGPMGTIALTLAMILDWCYALDEGQATLTTLPNIPLFDMANNSTGLPVTKAPPHGDPSVILPPATSLHTLPQPPSSPPLPSLTQLKRFLVYAEINLRICNTSQYENVLNWAGCPCEYK
ncbi:hypothetical protein HD554DRAFT_2240524 [Boletus coccyginus]|nr:hypothetical protein HD554DRAFT_2240524 [Boletus coccyginus]